MADTFRYTRPTEHLELYSAGWSGEGSPPPPTTAPVSIRDLSVVHIDDTVKFAKGEPDLRQFAVNTPEGNTIGAVMGFLADGQNHTLPFLYVVIEGGRIVVVPVDQVTAYPNQHLVTLEGGKEALFNAPDAQYNPEDAGRSLQYWMNYRRRNAA